MDPASPPSADEWHAFVSAVDRSYADFAQSRYLMERSLAISSQEMQELYEELRRSSESEVAAERDKLASVIGSLSDGLCVLDVEGRLELNDPETLRARFAMHGDVS